MGGSRVMTERGGHPDELIPLLPDERQVYRAVEDGIERAIVLRPVELVQRLFADRQAGHQTVAQQMAEAKQLIRIAMLIDKVFFGPQDGVVVQETVQHVRRLAERARDDLGMK